MTTNPTVAEMVAAHLREHGYDGLYDDWRVCWCDLDDLLPCHEARPDCQAGYRRPCDCEDECGFHIGAEKVDG